MEVNNNRNMLQTDVDMSGNRSSRLRVISPETWVMLPEILVMSPEKKGQAARRNKY